LQFASDSEGISVMTRLKNYQNVQLATTEGGSRVMLGEQLGLTGSEISVNCLPAGESIPFVHAHKQNEEVYLFTKGKGLFWLDGEVIPVSEGSVIRVSPVAGRCIKAADDENLSYLCIQAQENSLRQATRDDGIIVNEQARW